MKASLLMIAILYAGCASAPRHIWRPSKESRVVRVCVLNDAADLAPDDIVLKSIGAISREFDREAGIAFEVGAYLPFKGDINAHPLDLGPALRDLCPAAAEVRMLFTNRMIERKDAVVFGEDASNDDVFAGRTNPYFGFLIMYGAEQRIAASDAAGHPALQTALKHEIGHLFDISHSEDLTSFMHSPSNKSEGEWTDGVRRAIRANRFKRWFPHI